MRTLTEDIYPSRISEAPRILERRDPVVYGDPAEWGGGPLSAERLDEFDRKGFLFLPGFLTDEEVDACRAELDRLRYDEQVRRTEEAVIEPESDELRSLFRVHELSPFFARVAADRRIVSMARQILGGDVYIHQSRVNLKPGFAGKEFYWHSDFETWHIEDGMPRMRAVSCSILLTPNYSVNGPLMLIPGSHRLYVSCIGATPAEHYKRSLRKQEFGVPDHESLRKLVDRGGIEAPTGDAGSLLLFDCNTMHGSAGNLTPYPRTNLFMVYNSVENALDEPYGGIRPRPDFLSARDPRRRRPIEPEDVNYNALRRRLVDAAR